MARKMNFGNYDDWKLASGPQEKRCSHYDIEACNCEEESNEQEENENGSKR